MLKVKDEERILKTAREKELPTKADVAPGENEFDTPEVYKGTKSKDV